MYPKQGYPGDSGADTVTGMYKIYFINVNICVFLMHN